MHPIALILSSLLAAQTPAAPPPPSGYGIVNARIVVGNGQVVENGTIVVMGDKIVSVGTGPAPSGVKTIDGKGLTVYPGFIDGYSTAGVSLPDALPSGSNPPDITTTAPATMWHENRKNIRSDVKVADHLSLKGPYPERYKEGVTTVLVSGGAGTLAGTAALVDLTDKPQVLVSEAAEEIILAAGGRRFGGDEMAAGGQRRRGAAADDTAAPAYPYPGTLFGITALMRQTLWDAKAYAATDHPKADPTYAPLKTLVTGGMPAMFTISNAREIARAQHVSDEFGLKMIINGVSDAYRMIDVLKKENAPVIVSLDLPAEPTRTRTETNDTPQRVLDDRYAAYQERITNAKLLDAAGVLIAFRSASGVYLTKVRELCKASGLSKEAALRAMTTGPAHIFGVSDKLGTIEAGKTANLVLMTGDFLDEKSTVKTTLIEGVPHDTKEPAK